MAEALATLAALTLLRNPERITTDVSEFPGARRADRMHDAATTIQRFMRGLAARVKVYNSLEGDLDVWPTYGWWRHQMWHTAVRMKYFAKYSLGRFHATFQRENMVNMITSCGRPGGNIPLGGMVQRVREFPPRGGLALLPPPHTHADWGSTDPRHSFDNFIDHLFTTSWDKEPRRGW